jgi:uncharacterized damage-inducible protein DinB
MTWTAPQPTPPAAEPLVGDDRTILAAFLAWQRYTILNICAGLTGEQLAGSALPSTNLTLLGLVRHMAKVERTWLRERVAGQELEPMYDAALGKDADFEDLDPARAEQDFARLAEEMRLGDDAVASRSLEDTFDLRGEPCSLRLVYFHLVTEYARHNGHADLIRQAIDGTTGR